MGIDLRIHIRLKDGAKIPAWTFDDPDSPYDRWEAVDDEFPCGATHVYDSIYRLFDVDYHRGEWPMISAMLLALLENPNVERIWYDGDSGCAYHDKELTTDRFLNISRAFIELHNPPAGSP